MDIKITMRNEFKEIDNTEEMATILETIAEELREGVICGYHQNYEWHYIEEIC